MAEFERFFKIEIEDESTDTVYRNYRVKLPIDNLYDGNVLRLINLTHENGVFTQTTADTRDVLQLYVQAYAGVTLVASLATSKNLYEPGIQSVTFTKRSNFDSIRIGHNGLKLNVMFVIDVSYLTDDETYTIQINFTNVTPGSFSWQDIIIEKGTTATLPGNEPTAPDDMGIVASSMKLNEVLCSGDLRFGEYNSNKFEVQLFGLSDGAVGPMPDVTGFKITVTDWGTADSDELKHPIFTGTIDSATTDDKNGYRKIVAYDDMYKYKDIDIGKDWELFWTKNEGEHKTHTLKEIREAVCSFVGIKLAPSQESFPNDSKVFCYRDYQPGEMLAPNTSSITFSALLSAICELQCVCPNMTRAGLLEFISPMREVERRDCTENYAKNDTTFEDYTVLNATGFNLYANSTMHLFKYPDTDENSNPYIISGNIFLVTVTEDQARELLEEMRPKLPDIPYTPAKLSMIVSDLNANLGDIVQITMYKNEVAIYNNHCVMTQTLSGPQLVNQAVECKASGPNQSTTVPNTNDKVVQGLTAKEYNTKVDNLETRVRTLVTKDAVEIEINKAVKEVTEAGAEKVVTTNKKYVFDDSGINIADGKSEMSTVVSHDGMEIFKGNGQQRGQTMLKANNQGVDAQNLHATTYLIIGNRSRLEKYTKNYEERIGCFMTN